MLATLRTIRWSIRSASTNAARSAAIRSTASRAVRRGPGVAPVAEPGDRRAGAELRPGADAGRRGGQVVAAGGDPLGVEDPRVPPEFLGRLGERPLADVVPADHEVARLGQVEPLEDRQRRDQPGRRRQPSRQRREAQRDRRAHAAEGADQPETDATTCFGGIHLRASRLLNSSGGGNRASTRGGAFRTGSRPRVRGVQPHPIMAGRTAPINPPLSAADSVGCANGFWQSGWLGSGPRTRRNGGGRSAGVRVP